MLTDYHCHVLPHMDDGAQSIEISIAMLHQLKRQGVECVIATPHFYAHKERCVEDFLERRQRAYERLMKCDLPNLTIKLGAEVAIERGISTVSGIEQLAIEDSKLILMEYPYYGFANWMVDEVYHMSCLHHLQPVLAHLHRYCNLYEKKELAMILQAETECIVQINCEAFTNHKERQFVRKLMKNGYTYVFGSDAHGMSERSPNFDLLQKKCNSNEICISNNVYEQRKWNNK